MKNKFLLIAIIVAIFAGCKADDPEIRPTSKFTFTVNEGTVTFKNQSTFAKEYTWDFGDGSLSSLCSEKNPVKTYAKDGTYEVTLTVKNITLTHSSKQKVTVNKTGTPPSEQNLNAKFSYTIKQPMTVVLTNQSTGATQYSWDFGDGSKSTEKSPTHRYTGIGVYKVKLTAKDNSNKTSTYEKNVTIEAPTTCYMTGFVVKKIPTNNVYYQVQLTDDYLVSKTTYLYTDWFLLSSANLPYTYNLATKKKLDVSQTYVMRLYMSSTKTSGQASGKGDYSGTITSAQLKKYPETINWSGSNIGMDIYLEWK